MKFSRGGRETCNAFGLELSLKERSSSALTHLLISPIHCAIFVSALPGQVNRSVSHQPRHCSSSLNPINYLRGTLTIKDMQNSSTWLTQADDATDKNGFRHCCSWSKAKLQIMPKICFRDAKQWELLIEEMQMYIHVLSHAQVSYLLETEDCNFTTNRKVFVVTLLLIEPEKTKGNKVLYFYCSHFLTEVGDSEEELSYFISSLMLFSVSKIIPTSSDFPPACPGQSLLEASSNKTTRQQTQLTSPLPLKQKTLGLLRE